MTYKDMTFCPFWENCSKAKDCHRPLTDQVVRAAIKHNLPVSEYAERPKCHVLRIGMEDLIRGMMKK